MIQRFSLRIAVWKNYGQDVNKAWKHRADRMNKLPVCGIFKICLQMFHLSCGATDTYVLQLLYHYWKYHCHLIRISIKHGYTNTERQNNEYIFGNKRVQVGTHMFYNTN